MVMGIESFSLEENINILCSLTGLTKKELLDVIAEKPWEFFEYIKNIGDKERVSLIVKLHESVKRKEKFEQIKDNVRASLPQEIISKLNNMYFGEDEWYMEFIIMLHEKKIEITDDEVIYHKAGIAIKRQGIPCEIKWNDKLLEENREHSKKSWDDWPTCWIPLPDDRCAKMILQNMTSAQQILSSPYLILTKEHIDSIIWKYDTLKYDKRYNGSAFLFPLLIENTVISSEIIPKMELIDRHYSSQREAIYYMSVLNKYGGYSEQKVDNRWWFSWNFFIARKL